MSWSEEGSRKSALPFCGPDFSLSKAFLSDFFILWTHQGQSFQLPLAYIKKYWLQEEKY